MINQLNYLLIVFASWEKNDDDGETCLLVKKENFLHPWIAELHISIGNNLTVMTVWKSEIL